MFRRKSADLRRSLKYVLEGLGYIVVRWEMTDVPGTLGVRYTLLGGATVFVYDDGRFQASNREVQDKITQRLGYTP